MMVVIEDLRKRVRPRKPKLGLAIAVEVMVGKTPAACKT